MQGLTMQTMRVQLCSQLKAARLYAPDHFRDVCRREYGIAGIFALWAEGQEKVLSDTLSIFLQNRQHHLTRGSWVGCALQHDELSRPRMSGDGLYGIDYKRKVRITVLGQGRRHTDQNRVNLVQ